MNRMIRKLNKLQIAIVILIILVVVFISILRMQTQEKEIKIGALFSLSGDAAYFGEGELKAIQMAIDEENEKGGINGKKIKLVVEDIGTLNTVSGITALRKLVNVDNVNVIIGPTWDMPGVAVVAEEEKVVLISPDNTEGVEAGQNLEYFFSTWYPTRAEMGTLTKFAQEKNYSKVVILRDTDIYSQTVANVFIEAAKGKIKILDNYIVSTGTKDFRTDILKIKNLQADAILATFASEEPRGPLLKQIKELELKFVVLGTSAVENTALLENYADAAENILFYAYPKANDEQIKFLTRFKMKYGSEPTGPAAPNAYDAAKIAIATIKQGARNADEIKDILSKQEFQSVVFGKLKFDEKGFVSLESTDNIIKTVKNGKFVVYAE